MCPCAPRFAAVWALAMVGSIGGGCTSDEWPPLPAGDESSTGSPPEDLLVGARLEVVEPASPSIHPLGAPVHLRARVVDADGLAVDVDDVAWVYDAAPLLEVLEGDVELPAGVHELSALARLPDGARLQAAVGGVRVQAAWTGEYLGDVTLNIDATLPGGGPLALRCAGPLRVRVSLDGLTADVEDGTCSVDAFGQPVDGTYAIDITVYDAGLVRGTVDFAVDSPFGSVELPVEWAGAFYDDRFSGGLSGTAQLPFIGEGDVSGSLHALLVDPYVDPDEG